MMMTMTRWWITFVRLNWLTSFFFHYISFIKSDRQTDRQKKKFWRNVADSDIIVVIISNIMMLMMMMIIQAEIKEKMNSLFSFYCYKFFPVIQLLLFDPNGIYYRLLLLLVTPIIIIIIYHYCLLHHHHWSTSFVPFILWKIIIENMNQNRYEYYT